MKFGIANNLLIVWINLQKRCGYKSAMYFKNKILNPLITGGQLGLTIPEKPKHPKQKYVRKKQNRRRKVRNNLVTA